MKLISFYKMVVLVIFITFSYSQKDLYKDLPFKMKKVSVPEFPNTNINIKDFGAVGDGQTSNTEAFRKAIEACSKKGGGKVIVPAGIWLTGPIVFKNNINLHLQSGAFIQFSKNLKEYPLIENIYEGTKQFRCLSPLYGKNVNNIAITGDGIIDGAGEAWRPVKKFKMTEIQWNELISSGGYVDHNETWWPDKNAVLAPDKYKELLKQYGAVKAEDFEQYKVYYRPVLLSFAECKNVLLDGPTFQNSPAWNLHPLMCENLTVRNLTVRNPWYSQNGDGIDIESCKNVIVYNCRFDVGDDAICMKSGKDAEGRLRGKPTENVIISDCIVYHGHGGFTIGSEMSGGIKNIKIDNCSFIGTDVGLRFKSQRGRGGIVENIYISNIYMKNIPAEAISLNMFYTGKAPLEDKQNNSELKTEYQLNEGTPVFRKIYFKDIYCAGANTGLVIKGLTEMPINDLVFDNLVFSSETGIIISEGTNIEFKNSDFKSNSPLIQISSGKNIILDKMKPGKEEIYLSVEGSGNKNIMIKNIDRKLIEDKIRFSKDADKSSLIFCDK